MPFADSEKRKEYDRERSKDPKRREFTRQWQKANPERMYELTKRWKEKHPEKVNEYMRNYRKKNRMKNDARTFSQLAVAFGYIEREPCKTCGSENSQIHHLDYTDPLNIEWYCREHHRDVAHNGSFKQ